MVKIFTALRRRLIWVLSWREIKTLEASIRAFLAQGDVGLAVVACEKLVARYQWSRPVEQFLFKRSARPVDPLVSTRLLEALAASELLPRYQSYYAKIACIYEAMRRDSPDGVVVGFPWLCEQSNLGFELQALPSEVGLRNRESVYKQIISARACLLQSCFYLIFRDGAVGEFGGKVIRIGLANLRLLESVRFANVSPDVLVRSVSNLVLGLLPASIADPSSRGLMLSQLERLMAFVQLPCCKGSLSRAKEDHLFVLRRSMDLLRSMHDGCGLVDRAALLKLIVHHESAAVRAGAELWLQQF